MSNLKNTMAEGSNDLPTQTHMFSGYASFTPEELERERAAIAKMRETQEATLDNTARVLNEDEINTLLGFDSKAGSNTYPIALTQEEYDTMVEVLQHYAWEDHWHSYRGDPPKAYDFGKEARRALRKIRQDGY